MPAEMGDVIGFELVCHLLEGAPIGDADQDEVGDSFHGIPSRHGQSGVVGLNKLLRDREVLPDEHVNVSLGGGVGRSNLRHAISG